MQQAARQVRSLGGAAFLAVRAAEPCERAVCRAGRTFERALRSNLSVGAPETIAGLERDRVEPYPEKKKTTPGWS